jgi:hypothetical protein
MKGGNPTTIYILLADFTSDGFKIEWKDKPTGILLSGNSIFAATEIMKTRQIKGKNVLSPENISRLQYKETTYPEIIKSIPLLEFITNKLNEAQSDTNGVDDGISVIPNHTGWNNDSGFTEKKIIKHIINSDDKNHPVCCKLVEGNVTIQFDIDQGGWDPHNIEVNLHITYTIIVDLDGIIRCVIVKYTITNTNPVIESNAEGIKVIIQRHIIENLKNKLKQNPNSYLTTIPLRLEFPLVDTPPAPPAPTVINDNTPGVWVHIFGPDRQTRQGQKHISNETRYTPPSLIQKAAFERVKNYIEGSVSWNYEGGLRIFRILDTDGTTVAFIEIDSMTQDHRKTIKCAWNWNKLYVGNGNDRVKLCYNPPLEVTPP